MSASRFTSSVPYLLLKTARPRQWIKNLAIYASIFFTGFLFTAPEGEVAYFWRVTYAFGVFCLVTASVYTINDLIDAEADRHHPFKKKRPIASGNLPVPVALFAVGVYLVSALFFSLWLPLFFKLLIMAYLALQFAYSKYLKHVPIADVVSIATGFLIRVYAGAVVVNLHMSVWFLMTVISASLFLAVGKRQSERTLLNTTDAADIGSTRITLKRYSQRLLDQYTGMFATATWLTYALFTFQDQNITFTSSFLSLYSFLPRTLHSEKLLMLSLPLVILGVMRYLQLIYEQNQGESPDRVLLGDKPLLLIVLLFGLLSFTVLYVIG